MSASPGHGPARRTVLRGSAWALPVVVTAAAAPIAAASTSQDACLVAEFHDVMSGKSHANGSIRLRPTCQLNANEIITIFISPETSSGRLFQVQGQSALDWVTVPPNSSGSSSGTTKSITINRDVTAGEPQAYLNWNFSGYSAGYQPQTITVVFRNQVIATWTNPK